MTPHTRFLIGPILLALYQRSRPAWLLAGWVLIFHAWLALAFDPFHQPMRLKPQSPRYLLVYAIPMAVLVGWLMSLMYQRVSRWLTGFIAAGALALALICMAFNTLSYQAARATTVATQEAIRNGWFPLYTDVQSMMVTSFLLRGSPMSAQARPAQSHDFLAGVTTFHPIQEAQAYLLINQEYACRLERRNLVKPLDPMRFGMRVQEVLSVDHPLPAMSYVSLRALVALGNLVPVKGFRDKINESAAEVTAPGVAVVYRLNR